ncbi:MAG: hypothetical protein K0B07_04635 [DPANN group archaeon]|nr:hypothetical protein [DPANN group archaeon]
MDDNCVLDYKKVNSKMYKLNDYASFISRKLGCLLSEMSVGESPLFEIFGDSTFEIDYSRVLKDMKDTLSGDSLIGGISLIQSLSYQMGIFENLEDAVYSGLIYDISPDEKRDINRARIEKLTGYVEHLKSVKDKFDKDIPCALVYQNALLGHINYIDNLNDLNYNVVNKDQFKVEFEKTKFILKSSFLIYIGYSCIFRRLLDINKILDDNGLFVIGSDFIENSDVSFIEDDERSSLIFFRDIIKDEYRLSSFLKESNEPEIINCIEGGIFERSKMDMVNTIINGVYNRYSLIKSQSKSDI